MTQQVRLPIGRMVYGNPYEPRPKTDQATGKPRMGDDGKPLMDYSIGYAIAKGGEPMWWDTPWGALIYQEGAASAPQAVAAAVKEMQEGRDGGKFFAFKVIDGDSPLPNKNRKVPKDQEGYPGHWILRLGSSFAPKIVNRDGSAPILDVGAVKAGYFIQCFITMKGNNSAQSPGVYLNLGLLSLQGYGPEIVSGPDASAVGFGTDPAPAGMQAVPTGALAAPTPGLPAPPAASAPALPAAPVPPTVVTPVTSFLAPPGVSTPVPPAPLAAVPPAPPAGPQTTAKAQGASWAQLAANGWTEAVARQHGMIV